MLHFAFRGVVNQTKYVEKDLNAIENDFFLLCLRVQILKMRNLTGEKSYF